ncbi:argininosuccinate lyase [Fimbriimonas ginsengisoli]|uniref:Argininosuccinate lyase n=1 Tax=Fimbriimonas ginsengisoli Gsoil 348 TaxID=661478 RepID=A0A068NQN9_FIMGI|nr:argininosuccinate lyase [Fimbriimonas ginsengisoli]AIE85687.1 argininosuccinate lyase [Fimbriimonas ginsengisoli Gsoil 348]
MKKVWGGAFSESSNDLVDRFGQSIESDLNFWQEDIIGSVAHARMLGEVGIITKEEADILIRGLEKIHEEGPDFLHLDVEDVHTAIEIRLKELVGDVGGKLHTARSRNDQVATDTRLYVHNQLIEVQDLIKKLQGLLLRKGEEFQGAIMPGYTHQQRAQPITLGFHLMAHFWALQRHGWRAERLFELANYSPLGAAALAGTSFPIDREMTAKELGFIAPIPNALDATSDRSYILDTLHLCALIMLDLSRISQELVLYSGREFAFVKLSDTVTTGSSIMPQKRNPDMAELIRGRTARAVSNWVTLAGVMKGLPLGYNRDTQEDKPPLFDSLRKVKDSIELVFMMIDTADWQLDRMATTVRGDFSTATDLADYLAAQGMPFREAHELVGQVVRGCDSLGCALEDLTEAQLAQIAPGVPKEALSVLQPEDSVRRRESLGAPGPNAMATQLAHARRMLEAVGFPKVA